MAAFDCNFCGDAILDQHIFQVDDKVWHENCIKCASCKCQLTEKCFVKNGVLYCRKDFTRIFGSKCAGCGSAIFDSDLVQKLRSNGEVKLLYHADCLCCSQCRCKFQPGSEVYFSSVNKALCFQDFSSVADSRSAEDYIQSPESEHCVRTPTPKENCPQNNQAQQQQANIGAFADDMTTCESWTGDLVDAPIQADSVDSSVSSGDSMALCVPVTKRRGPRTTIKAKQLDSLKAAFAATPKPTRHIREQLAQDTGLSMRVIQVWFQNRRSKERRMKQLNVLGGRRHIFERNLPRHMQLNPGPQNQQHPANIQCFFPDNSIYQPNYNHGIIPETGGLLDPYSDVNLDQASAWSNQSPTNPSVGGLLLSQCGHLGSYPAGEGDKVYYGPGETPMSESLCRKNSGDPLVKSEMHFWNHN